ncbi:MAG: sigma 54-interacting transcriptional regulator, partial [Methylophilus sp.]|nr:sigma 54-interacting transcriptional regulator [Methylophilus sp.]
FRASHHAEITVHFHARPEFIGTLWEGIAMFSSDGQLLAMNRSGQFQFGLNLQSRNLSLLDMRFERLFDMTTSALLNQVSNNHSLAFPIRLHSGARIYAKLEVNSAITPALTPSNPIKRSSAASLDMLNSGDPNMALAIEQVKRVINRDIPILIQGETGTGKELFARAIHDASLRHNKPWIAVNCASLPEGLIEAELFGYEEGAFTGAKRKGSPGKIEQADGGTLFLDEIGDMPLPLQARLLRVLQERVVTPLGSTKSIPVNFTLISATNQKLKQKVAQGEFRSDLYYRLNGLNVNLPALRERKDLQQLISLILQIEQVSDADISPQAKAILEQHPWPGNIRQLHNVIRTALALADGTAITPLHFTVDFIEEFQTELPQEKQGVTDVASPRMTKQVTLPQQALKQVADDAIKNGMQQHAGNISALARQLGISRNTLYRKLRLLGLA